MDREPWLDGYMQVPGAPFAVHGEGACDSINNVVNVYIAEGVLHAGVYLIMSNRGG